jgi:phosphatidylinositol-3-phosphatase
MKRVRHLWRQPLVRAAFIVPIVVLLLGTGVLAFGHAGPAHAAASSSSIHSDNGRFKHVFIIMMENTGIEALLGNPNAPWINQEISASGVAGNYYGVTHPSQPNYIAATSGALNGVTSDSDTTLNVTNIVDQLESNGKTWTAYMQSLNDCLTGTASPSAQTATYGYKMDHACGTTDFGNQLYERKHNPFVSYQDVYTNPARLASVVDFSQLSTDLANNTVSNYVWISPDQCHDMHGVAAPTPVAAPCDFSQEQSLIAAGDSFLSTTVAQITASPVWRNGSSVIYITWDESDFTGSGFQGFGDDRGCCDSPAGMGGGHVLTLVITKHGGAQASFTPYNHYSLLAAVEDNWHLGCIANTCDTANVAPIEGLAG